MQKNLNIAGREVGDGYPCLVVAEIGLNHNGSVAIARELVREMSRAGCDAVKFQKRTLSQCYSADELLRPHHSPLGETFGQMKHGLELNHDGYQEISVCVDEHRMFWFASVWDLGAVDFLEEFSVPCYKVPSARINDMPLLRKLRSLNRPVIMSTGMSKVGEIDEAVDCLGTDKLILMHTVSAYPAQPQDLNLSLIPWLRDRYECLVGYSGHEVGISTTLAAVALGACVVERHVTLDRTMWGSDHAASIEPVGVGRMVAGIQSITKAIGKPEKKVLECERAKLYLRQRPYMGQKRSSS